MYLFIYKYKISKNIRDFNDNKKPFLIEGFNILREKIDFGG
tara:strand:+ start:444 stop:566 length:123 start_codon:yes stop_codon:yes gene_type:complete